MNYKVEDFVLEHIEFPHQDLWFDIVGDTKKALTDKYREQSMIEVNKAVYSLEDKKWAIRQLFPFNYTMITPKKDKELLSVLREAAMRDKERALKGLP